MPWVHCLRNVLLQTKAVNVCRHLACNYKISFDITMLVVQTQICSHCDYATFQFATSLSPKHFKSTKEKKKCPIYTKIFNLKVMSLPLLYRLEHGET